MDEGMMWFDNDPKTDLTAKVSEAAAYYQKKYGNRPDTCIVHPTMSSSSVNLNGIEISTNRVIRPNYLWIGVAE